MKIHNISSVEIIEVIRVSITAGTGVDETDVLRPAFQYWSKDGELLAETDQYAKRNPDMSYLWDFLHSLRYGPTPITRDQLGKLGGILILSSRPTIRSATGCKALRRTGAKREGEAGMSDLDAESPLKTRTII